jgi:hypothetical protein
MRDRRVWYGVGALVVLLIFGWAVWLFTKPAPQTSGENAMVTQEQATTTTATTTTSTATSSAPSSTKTTTSKPLSYQQALAAYINRRIQIQSNCQLSPSAPVFKNGTYVMFDNRTPTAQTISLDGARYTIGGYGFKIIRLYASRLPHTIQIDCGSGRNNGRIVLQG